MFSNESQSVIGDVIEHDDGSRYVVLPNGTLAYLGNRVLARSTDLQERSGRPCRILGRMALLPYVQAGEEEIDGIERDWDRLRRRERIPIPLPKGCTCGHDALVAVSTCEVHDVKLHPPSPASFLRSVRFRRSFEISANFRVPRGTVWWRTPAGLWPHHRTDRSIDFLLEEGTVEIGPSNP